MAYKNSNLPHLHVFKTHFLLLHWNSFGSQRPDLHPFSSDPSVQSKTPSQIFDLAIQSPFMQVA